jgi:hypothetical protein
MKSSDMFWCTDVLQQCIYFCDTDLYFLLSRNNFFLVQDTSYKFRLFTEAIITLKLNKTQKFVENRNM